MIRKDKTMEGSLIYCPNCGYQLAESGTELISDPGSAKGFVEVHFAKNGYDGPQKYSPDAGYIKIYTDDDMEWMIPVKRAESTLQVLYSGLSEFLDKHTETESSINLYVDDRHVDNTLSGKGPIYSDDKRYWSVLKNKLKYRPYVLLNYIHASLLQEKLKFLKARFNKGQKGKKHPVKKGD